MALPPGTIDIIGYRVLYCSMTSLRVRLTSPGTAYCWHGLTSGYEAVSSTRYDVVSPSHAPSCGRGVGRGQRSAFRGWGKGRGCFLLMARATHPAHKRRMAHEKDREGGQSKSACAKGAQEWEQCARAHK